MNVYNRSFFNAIVISALILLSIRTFAQSIVAGTNAMAPSDGTAKISKPPSPSKGFKHQYALINGVKTHYMIGGTGEPPLLVHGFVQNWYMWNRLLTELSKHFTVIAPDLPGVGESGGVNSSWQAIYQPALTLSADIN